MSRPLQQGEVLASWTNGRRSIVHLIKDVDGDEYIFKCYRPGNCLAFVRECFVLNHLADQAIFPRLLHASYLRQELSLSRVPGERVLEWVMKKHGAPDLDLDKYQSYHGLDDDQDIAEAFACFRASEDPDSVALKAAIVASYEVLHRKGLTHGDPSPRNLLYDGSTVHLIDFDGARPSPAPARTDRDYLLQWYGLEPRRPPMGVIRRALCGLEDLAKKVAGS